LRLKASSGKTGLLFPTKTEMSAHSFRTSKELQVSVEVPSLTARMEASKVKRHRRIVMENDQVMRDGGFMLPSGWQSVPPAPGTERIACPLVEEEPVDTFRFNETEVCVANADTLTAALVIGDALALNFANAYTPGGGYIAGCLAQEEELCRLLPQLYPSLKSCHYPINPGEALVTQGLLAVRQVFSHEPCSSQGEVGIVTAAMPDRHEHKSMAAAEWAETVSLRIRAVLHAAKSSGLPNLVLGAFGCGAFGNPPADVAAIFRRHLESSEFRGCFKKIVFAIIDPARDGNLLPFREEMSLLA